EVPPPVPPCGLPSGEFLGEMGRHRVVEHCGAMLEHPDLLLDRPRHGGMSVADPNDAIHAEEVEIFLALLIPQILARAACEDERSLIGDEGTLRGGVVSVPACDD